MFAQHRFAPGERTKHPVHPEEERLAQGKAGRDILAVDREQPRQLDLSGMQRSKAVEPGGIGLEHAAHVGGKRSVMVVRGRARAEPMIGKVDPGAVLPGNRAIAPTGHRNHVLQGGKVILGVRECHPERDIGVGAPMNMRHAEFIARDIGGVADRGRGRTGLFGQKRFPAHQAHQRNQDHTEHGPAGPGQILTHISTLCQRRM